MATLYEVSQDILNCVEMEDGTNVNVETGEIISVKKLDELNMTFDEKVRNLALWRKDLKAYSDALKAEKQSIDKRGKATDNKIAQIDDYLMRCLNGKKVKDPQYEIGYRKSKSVNILDEKLLPKDYLIPQPDKVDKLGIRKVLKDGGTVPGAELQENTHIQIK